MSTYMDSLLLQNDYTWAPKFLDSLEKQPHLKWLTDKIKKNKDDETTARAPARRTSGTCDISFLKFLIILVLPCTVLARVRRPW